MFWRANAIDLHENPAPKPPRTSPMTLDMLPWRLQLRLESPAALKQLRCGWHKSVSRKLLNIELLWWCRNTYYGMYLIYAWISCHIHFGEETTWICWSLYLIIVTEVGTVSDWEWPVASHQEWAMMNMKDRSKKEAKICRPNQWKEIIKKILNLGLTAD